MIVASIKALPLVVFGVVVSITLVITYWASKRTKSARRLLGREPRRVGRCRTGSPSPATTCPPPRSWA